MADRVHSGSPWEPLTGFCRARRVGDRILVAGTAPIPPAGEEVAATPGDQMRRCGAIAIDAIEQLGGRASHVVRTRMFITDPVVQTEVAAAHRELFGEAEPVATMVVTGLLDPAWFVEIEVEAIVTD